ncbi:LppU/SCO3897 family protein [Actinoplanes sp. CA-030573]|uniref:LppU/SCO3897 family protein n=1 Tax=Actinoplanes sp. CA-030573 TaxID=3239898 RepID=UPI003D8CEAD4
MSQNGPHSGPPWSHGSSDEPYAEPADPWGDQGAGVTPDPSWGGHPPSIPQQPVSYPSAPISGASMWGQPSASPPPPEKRNTPIIALVVTLGVLICIGLGTTAWLLKVRNDKPSPTAGPSDAATNPGPAPIGSEDARFNVKQGDCVVNDGTDAKPEMRKNTCTTGTYEVLKRIDGKTTGEKDAESKCAKVPGYTKWYFYDSPLDDLDFVLCLKEHKSL